MEPTTWPVKKHCPNPKTGFSYSCQTLFYCLVFDVCRFCVVIRFFSPPPQRPMTSDFEGFSIQILSITFILLSYFMRNSQHFPFQGSVLKKGTTGTIFITSLVWRGPWLGIEPRTSRTRSQQSTTRLSRRRCTMM